MPFKALLWLGNEERGLGWYAESDRSWQPEDPEKAIELVRDGEQLFCACVCWTASPKPGRPTLRTAYTPIIPSRSASGCRPRR